MLRSLFAGISGLRVNQTALDVTGNNIANANTIGFKSSSTVFSDTLSQMLTAASAPATAGNLGGTNAIQIGLGTQLAAVKTNFTQGANETTGVASDMMVSGDGFFVLADGALNANSQPDTKFLTRAGAFSFDANGNLVAPDGKFVMGYAVTNFDATDPTATTFADNGATDLTDAGVGQLLSKINLKNGGANNGADSDGVALQSYTIGRDGIVTGTYSDGTRRPISKLAIANVQNVQGLEKSGDSEYVASPNSGAIEYGSPASTTAYGQNGLITTGALEMSNVDLSQEFTNLILAQRGFQASSKVITTSDEILDTLIQMKR